MTTEISFGTGQVSENAVTLGEVELRVFRIIMGWIYTLSLVQHEKTSSTAENVINAPDTGGWLS